MTLLRKLFAILLVLGCTGSLMIGYLIFFVDPDRLKPMIINETLKKTGYRLSIEGHLVWSFYPLLGVKVSHLTLTAPGQVSPCLDLREVTLAMPLSEWLRPRQALQGKLHANAMKLLNVTAQAVRMDWQWQNDILTLQPMSASLYGGSLEGRVIGSHLATTPHWEGSFRFRAIRLKPLLDDIKGEENKIKLSGVGEGTLQVVTRGQTQEQLVDHLNGSSEIRLTKGAIEGVDINYLVQSAEALMNKQLPPPQQRDQTAVDALTASFVIRNGIMTTDNLLLISSAFQAKGRGEVNLLNQTLHYRLLVTPIHTTKLKGSVPLLVGGDLRHPIVHLDRLAIKVIMTTEKIEKIRTKIEEHIKDLPKKTDKWLKAFLNGRP